ncbi:carbohydrate ABC transporter permease [Paenibacillus agricola]|uniref:Carbohydrate ABC transporter permease n=1 Tax=Paenibacillus agricola TaxID=2716264 RepID=A0ABX0J507_9BACL|nr:carbohydrate ABC transporter permease [Paenibacillus agricola]NHN31477.1 carbohydrate ABC transporter permease [Paenibacillus agricola]
MSFVHQKHLTPVDWVNYTLLAFISLVCLFPFLYVVSVSLTDPEVYVPLKFYLVPEQWSFASYKFVLGNDNFINALKSTVWVTIVGTAFNLVFTFTMAYGLTKKWFPGRNLILGCVIVTLVFNPGLVPNYLLVKELGMLNSYWALILPSITNAWSLIVVKSFMDSLPSEMEDAAKIDGCNDLGVFMRIVLPLSMPALAAFSLFFAVAHWNTYFNAMIYLSDSKKWTLQVLIKTMIIDSDAIGFGPDAGSAGDKAAIPQETIKMATIVLSMLPIIIIYPWLQKYFAQGVMLGSIKG